ncbi:RHS repeat domain-containing protein [Oligella urethralis]|uniref:RHS repeat domain-containing protein n=1 Tax=Oligella urethralis TaxID=90245 RepID=UPI002155A973|nr:RHS repeat-associated core domain-containing protein [Oligella urethralis]
MWVHTGNLLKRISGYHFDYDARGNLTRKESHKGIQTFSWDAHNQLTRSTSFSSATEPKLCTDYLYDVFGRRIAKRMVDEHRHTIIEQTLYDWEGLTIASEERIGQQLGKHAANSGRDWQNAPVLALNVQYLYEDGQFVPLAQSINSSDGQAELLSSRGWQAELAEETQVAPKLYHYVCDHLGTPQLLMNQGQEVVWEAKAKAWGETRVMSRSATDEQVINNHRFQGQYYDAETSLHYNTFRYYDPELGRFISQDPIGLMGGINLYQYAPNPVEWVDPLGLAYAKIVVTSVFGIARKLYFNRKGQFAKKPGPKPKTPQKTDVHGNSHQCSRTAYGYKLKDRDTDEVLKFGETIAPKKRYQKSFLERENARMEVVKSGSKKQMHQWQHMEILNYTKTHGRRPKLNKSDW